MQITIRITDVPKGINFKVTGEPGDATKATCDESEAYAVSIRVIEILKEEMEKKNKVRITKTDITEDKQNYQGN